MFIIYMSIVVVWVLCGFVAYGYHYAHTKQEYATGDPDTSDETGVAISLAVSWFYCYAFGVIALVQVFRKSLNTRGWYNWQKTENKQ